MYILSQTLLKFMNKALLVDDNEAAYKPRVQLHIKPRKIVTSNDERSKESSN